MDRQYNDQKKHGQAIQRPKETWIGNTTTKRNMDRQCNDQKKHGQIIKRLSMFLACFFWLLYCLSIFLLVVILPVHVSFGLCIACSCFFWSLYCLSMFLLVVLLSVHVSFGRCIYNYQKKHGQAIQLPKETWTDNTTTKRNMDRQYNDQRKHGQAIQRPKEAWTDNTTTKRDMDRQYKDQKKHGQAIQLPKETWTDNTTTGLCIACSCFFWYLYCLSMFLLAVVLSVHVSFGRCIVCLYFCWSLYETWTGNTKTKRNMDRQYNDQKKHGQTIQRPKETWTDNTTTKRNMQETWTDNTNTKRNIGGCIVCPCFFW
jgi:Flp pilus assembly protein TadB